MKYNAVVLDADNLFCISIMTLIEQAIPQMDVYPINSIAELGGIASVVTTDIDLLVANVTVEESSGRGLLKNISKVSPTAVIFYHEDSTTSPDTVSSIADLGYTMISLDAPTAVWISTLRHTFEKVLGAKQLTAKR